MEAHIKMFTGYIATIRNIKELKTHRDLNKRMEIVGFSDLGKGNVNEEEVVGFVDRYKSDNLNFDDCFMYSSMQEMKDNIDCDNYETKKRLSKQQRKDYGLYDTSGGGLLVVDVNGRMEGFEDTIHYKGKYPTKKVLKDLFEEVVSSGAKNFKIIYDCMVRSYDSYQDKFSGCGSDPTGEWIETILVSRYNF